jgi:hypothetical protein
MIEMRGVEAAKAALEKLCSSKKGQLERSFAQLYPSVRAALERGESRRSILAELGKHGFKMSSAKLKALLEGEEQRRAGL